MKIDKLNADHICSVKSYINCINSSYEYREERRYFFFWKKKTGFYYINTFQTPWLVSQEVIEGNGKNFCHGKHVLYRPHLEIKMSDKSSHEFFFKEEKDLFEFMNIRKLRRVNWVNKI